MTKELSKSALATVALMRIRGIGRRAAVRLVEKPLLTEDDERGLFDRAARQRIDGTLLREAWLYAEEQLRKSEDVGIRASSFFDETYPARLRSIPDPPAVLFVKGNSQGLNFENTLAVVGTREPTDYGQRVSRRLAAIAVDMGFSIVSGLAHGCDTFAHEGCVEAAGTGIAVLAHGLDKVYPAANKKLAQRLLEHGGCLVSEYPIGITPMRTAFAERDRIQSGLSDGVLVIETDVKGGTMHTVNFARQQKRTLACIDHPAVWHTEAKVQGNRMMISERWAEPIANGDDLTDLLRRIMQRPRAVCETVPHTDPQGKMDF